MRANNKARRKEKWSEFSKNRTEKRVNNNEKRIDQLEYDIKYNQAMLSRYTNKLNREKAYTGHLYLRYESLNPDSSDIDGIVDKDDLYQEIIDKEAYIAQINKEIERCEDDIDIYTKKLAKKRQSLSALEQKAIQANEHYNLSAEASQAASNRATDARDTAATYNDLLDSQLYNDNNTQNERGTH